MPISLFKNLFVRAAMDQLAKYKGKCIIIQTYKKSGILQVGVCSVTNEHKDEHRLCRFFVAAVNGLVC